MSQVSPGWYRSVRTLRPALPRRQSLDGARRRRPGQSRHRRSRGPAGPGLICGLGAALRPGWSALVRPVRAAGGGRRAAMAGNLRGAVRPGRNGFGAPLRPGVRFGAWLRPVGSANRIGARNGRTPTGAMRPARRDGLGSGGRRVGSPRAADRRPATSGPRAPDNSAGWRRLGSPPEARRRVGTGGRQGQGPARYDAGPHYRQTAGYGQPAAYRDPGYAYARLARPAGSRRRSASSSPASAPCCCCSRCSG